MLKFKAKFYDYLKEKLQTYFSGILYKSKFTYIVDFQGKFFDSVEA
jgi:hypothetical protein